MSRATDNHFISVSRKGELIARRKGQAPVRIADARRGLTVQPPDDAVGRGVPPLLCVMFVHGGGNNREVCVTEIVVGDRRMDVSAFQEQYAVSDGELGRWMRAAVEAAMDAALGTAGS